MRTSIALLLFSGLVALTPISSWAQGPYHHTSLHQYGAPWGAAAVCGCGDVGCGSCCKPILPSLLNDLDGLLRGLFPCNTCSTGGKGHVQKSMPIQKSIPIQKFRPVQKTVQKATVQKCNTCTQKPMVFQKSVLQKPRVAQKSCCQKPTCAQKCVCRPVISRPPCIFQKKVKAGTCGKGKGSPVAYGGDMIEFMPPSPRVEAPRPEPIHVDPAGDDNFNPFGDEPAADNPPAPPAAARTQYPRWNSRTTNSGWSSRPANRSVSVVRTQIVPSSRTRVARQSGDIRSTSYAAARLREVNRGRCEPCSQTTQPAAPRTLTSPVAVPLELKTGRSVMKRATDVQQVNAEADFAIPRNPLRSE